MSKKNSEKLAALLEKENQLKAQIQQLKQREREEERKKDTRRKILIGGAILAKVKRGEWHMNQLHDLLNGELKADRDRDLFDLPKLNQELAKTDTGDNNGGNRS
ncbi:TPA: mobilization protein [Vibrio parahaemolyticus]|nr:mobilization protein [Vibrio parahaemolyticus]